MVQGVDAEVYRALLAASTLAVVVHGADGKVVEANQSFANLLGYTLDEANRLRADQVIHPGDLPRRDAEAEALFAGHNDGAVVHRRLLRKDGDIIRARVRKTVIYIDGSPVVMVAIEAWGRDGDLEYCAWHDELTGLLNRRGLREQATVTYPTQPVLVAMVDVDGLKQVNDRHGHAAGDVLLVSVADALQQSAPGKALVGRWAGDEFVLLTPVSDAPATAGLIASLRTHVCAPIQLPGSGCKLAPSASIGTSVHLPDQESLDDALHRADAVMYRDKHDRYAARTVAFATDRRPLPQPVSETAVTD